MTITGIMKLLPAWLLAAQLVVRQQHDGVVMNGQIQYLNTDMDLASSEDLTALAEALKTKGLFALHVTRSDDGLWYAKLETEEVYHQPEENIAVLIAAVESLVGPLRTVWFGCALREFNMGYDCGSEPWAFEQGLSSDLLGRMAALGVSLRLTLYPEREHSAERSHAPDAQEDARG